MNLFDTVSEGYAKSRPALHARILDRVRSRLRTPVERALDVGCGSGLSTRALLGFARERYGLEPTVSMLRWTGAVAPGAEFVAGYAEQMPVRSGTIDLITAAGSLNFADIDAFFPEAARVLSKNGMLVVYDFSQGRSFSGSTALSAWFQEFAARYPRPAGTGRALDPEILKAMNSGFRMETGERFEIGLTLDAAFYVDYMMTEVNVTCAIAAGVPGNEIRDWCAETLRGVFQGQPREVLFPGYIACLRAQN